MPLLLYQSETFLAHQTGKGHPENRRRIEAIAAALASSGIEQRAVCPAWQAAMRQDLERVHTSDYLDALATFVNQGGGLIERDTMVSDRSLEVAMLASGAICDAVGRVLSDAAEAPTPIAFAAVRPPGHHALAGAAMGFCLLNHIAVAARYATDRLQLDRVLIIDWDVHHGNGTQAIFWEDPRVGFYSIHRWPFYPGTGDSNETGAGRGAGTTMNVPITYGTSRREYLETFASSVTTFASRIKPQLILISAGFDAHRLDPVGSLGLESEDFATMTDIVLALAHEYAGGRIVSALEGGYHPAALAESVIAHLERLAPRLDTPAAGD